MNKARILVVDDEPQIRRTLRAALAPWGYAVTDASSGELALEQLRESKPDLILLDLNMPGMGGLEACRQIRTGSDAAIIVLTVRGEEQQKVAVLDAGADDYVTKPFSMPELLARIRAALRRAPAKCLPRVILADSFIDFETRRVQSGDKEIRLTPKEYDLLHFLCSHANQVLSHRKLLQTVWGPEYGEELEYLRVFVNQLRKKIEPDPLRPQYLITEPRTGYSFRLPTKRS
jgi:two-component system KDP operon response regulator KdpE